MRVHTVFDIILQIRIRENQDGQETATLHKTISLDVDISTTMVSHVTGNVTFVIAMKISAMLNWTKSLQQVQRLFLQLRKEVN